MSESILQPSDLDKLLAQVSSRAKTLLSPLVDDLPKGMSPTDADFVAVLAMLSLCNKLLSNLLIHSNTKSMKSAKWLTHKAWIDFGYQLKDIAFTFDSHPDIRYNGEDKYAIIGRLMHTVGKIAANVRNLSFNSKLFREHAQEIQYMDIVTAMNHQFIENRNPSHKESMVLYALMYEAIRRQRGVAKEFYGSDYDHLLLDLCHIQYNESSIKDKASEARKGRLRSVREAWLNRFAVDEEKRVPLGDYRGTFNAMQAFIEEKLFGGRLTIDDSFVPEGLSEF